MSLPHTSLHNSASQILTQHKPYLLYGTAWKKDQTPVLVTQALLSGFRFIDTACQPKHYNELGVGQGLADAISRSNELGLSLNRGDVYLQTKFTPLDGQDPDHLPYDPQKELEDQVRQSLQLSLKNLGTSYLDCLVLHSPLKDMDDTMRVWKVFESFVDSNDVLRLGISNIYSMQKLQRLYDDARIKPSIVQNRFVSDPPSKFDVRVREFCKDKGITYQSFWTLTGNRGALMNSEEVKKMAEQKGLTRQTLMYAFMMSLGHTPLSGTTDEGHMKEDVDVMRRMQKGEVLLDEAEIGVMKRVLGIP